MKSKCPSWRSPAPSRPRCQGRGVFAFIGAKWRPLTGEVGGLGAVLPQEGQRGKKKVPLGTYRGQLWFCGSVKTDVEEGLQEKVLVQERRSARGEKLMRLWQAPFPPLSLQVTRPS
jgi:hypothetical protein